MELAADGNAIGVNHDKNTRLLRQDKSPQYLEAGSVYVMQAAKFRDAKHRFFGKTTLHIAPGENRLEIDEPVDLTIAETLLRKQRQKNAVELLPSPTAAVVFDFDGVFTDNRVIVSEDGSEAVVCDRSDGLGIARLRQAGIPMVVISTEKNPVVKQRCQKLNLDCLQDIDEKLPVLKSWLAEQGIDLAHTVYVGNDINDFACLQAVGCGVVVQDAYPEAHAAAKLVLAAAGGQGAVREIAELILSKMQG